MGNLSTCKQLERRSGLVQTSLGLGRRLSPAGKTDHLQFTESEIRATVVLYNYTFLYVRGDTVLY